MTVELEFCNDVAWLRLNRPEALNALSAELLNGIDAALDKIAVTRGVRALFVTGSGHKAFSAGADVNELRVGSATELRQKFERGHTILARFDRLPIVSIALVNGFALGGGMELALACTFRIASREAKFGLPEIKLGLLPGYGGTQRLPRLIGEPKALEMILTGRIIGADEALAVGLIQRIADGSLAESGEEFVRSFSHHSLAAQYLARQAVLESRGATLEEGLKAERRYVDLVLQTADASEGMSAFVDKRQPSFRDE